MDIIPYDAIVLSGGGIKGILELGALHYHYEKGTYDPEYAQEYAGTSIGSAICLLLICGYTPMDIFAEVYNMDSFFTVDDCHSVWNIIKYMGFMSINGFASKLEELVKRKMNDVPSLKKLKEITGKRLCVVGSNITKMVEELYSPETTPNLNCVDAVKISCNLPLIFQRLKYRSCYVVDGGPMNNFPWNHISSERKKILGIVAMGTDYFLPDDTFMGYFYRLMMLPNTQLTNLRCKMAPKKVTIIKVVWSGEALFQFVMNSKQKMDMLLKGYGIAENEDNVKFLHVKGWNYEEDSSM